MPYEVPQFVRDELAELFEGADVAKIQFRAGNRDEFIEQLEEYGDLLQVTGFTLRTLAARMRRGDDLTQGDE